MSFLEKNIEDIIYENIDRIGEAGLDLSGCILRQVSLGCYGIADLLVFDYQPNDRHLIINIIELKKGKIGHAELSQLCRYVTCIDEYISEIETPQSLCIEVNGIVVGDDIQMGSDVCFLYNHMNYNIKAYEYKYDFYGIKFKYISKTWQKTGDCKDDLCRLSDQISQHVKDCIFSRTWYRLSKNETEKQKIPF